MVNGETSEARASSVSTLDFSPLLWSTNGVICLVGLVCGSIEASGGLAVPQHIDGHGVDCTLLSTPEHIYVYPYLPNRIAMRWNTNIRLGLNMKLLLGYLKWN